MSTTPRGDPLHLRSKSSSLSRTPGGSASTIQAAQDISFQGLEKLMVRVHGRGAEGPGRGERDGAVEQHGTDVLPRSVPTTSVKESANQIIAASEPRRRHSRMRPSSIQSVQDLRMGGRMGGHPMPVRSRPMDSGICWIDTSAAEAPNGTQLVDVNTDPAEQGPGGARLRLIARQHEQDQHTQVVDNTLSHRLWPAAICLRYASPPESITGGVDDEPSSSRPRRPAACLHPIQQRPAGPLSNAAHFERL